MTPRLEVLISTYGTAGLERLAAATLPHVDDVAFVVSCQATEPYPAVPQPLVRDDLRIVFTPTRGLSANRNHSFDIARAPYILIADDDLDFEPDGLRAVIAVFDSDPALDIATFRHTGFASKVYPADGHNLSRKHRGYYITSFELALRLDAVRRTGLRFSELMGIGAPFATQGEEEVFVINALRAGLKGRFVDTVVATHTGPTTGLRDNSAGAMHARGVILAKRHPMSAIFRAPVVAWRLRRQASVPRCAAQIMAGVLFAYTHRL